MSSEDIQVAGGKGIPGFAKTIMILQTVVIAFFAFWMSQEYSNNQYFQVYVNTYLQGSGLMVATVGSIGVFTAVAVGLYAKLRGTRRILEHALNVDDGRTGNSGSATILEPHVEQHLIEMIRKTTPDTASTASTMPVLRREDPNASHSQA